MRKLEKWQKLNTGSYISDNSVLQSRKLLLFCTVFVFLIFVLSGCATTPATATPIPTITLASAFRSTPTMALTPTPSPTLTPTPKSFFLSILKLIPTPTLTPTPSPTLTPVPTLTPRTTPTRPTTPLVTIVEVSHVDVDSMGNYLSDGHVVLVSYVQSADLAGWTLTDAFNNVYKFEHIVLESGTGLVLHAGEGQNNANNLYWGLSQEVWNQGVSKLTLKNAEGFIIDIYFDHSH